MLQDFSFGLTSKVLFKSISDLMSTLQADSGDEDRLADGGQEPRRKELILLNPLVVDGILLAFDHGWWRSALKKDVCEAISSSCGDDLLTP